MKGDHNRISWSNKIIDLFVVIVGVSIAFTLSNWQLSNQSDQIQQHYLISLRNDLLKDQAILSNDIKLLRKQIYGVNKLFEYSNGKLNATDSLDEYMKGILHQGTFYPNNFTFQSIIQSGNITNFEDLDFVRDLTELYNGSYVQIKELEGVSMRSFEEHIIGKIISGESLDDTYLKSKSFGSLASVMNGLNLQKQNQFVEALERISKLLSSVDSKINK
jgi:Family of unknown function (DUF6090)